MTGETHRVPTRAGTQSRSAASVALIVALIGVEMRTRAKATASQANELEQLLTTTEVARLLRISRVTLWEWRRKGLVPAPVRVGLNRLRWRANEVRDYLRTRPAS
jgi:excisionase family DNA binding protein